MDSGKKQKLTEVEWQLAKSCATCIFGCFNAGQSWGVCTNPKTTYFHNKHQRTHQLPANVNSVCSLYSAGGNEVNQIQAFLTSEVTS